MHHQGKLTIFSFYLMSYLLIFRGIGAQIQRTMASSSSGIYSVAYVTVPNDDIAKKLAHGLVGSKLAACVNIIPQIKSVYEWNGKIEEDNELLLMIKTRTDVIGNLTKYVKENHPYKICEVISLPIENGNEQYLNWIGEAVLPAPAMKTTP